MHPQISPAVRALLFFLSDNYVGLQNAAFLLGGSLALKQTQFMLAQLSGTPSLTRRVKSNLVALHQLLTLQNVGDPDRVETALHADIDPWDRVVADLCLLADGLLSHLEAIDEEAEHPVFDFDAAA